MNPAPPPNTSSKRLLWLLALTVAVGAALAATGITGYIEARRNARHLAAAEVEAMLQGLRRTVLRAPGAEPLDTALAAYFTETETGEFTAAAIIDPHGNTRGHFGHNHRPFQPSPLLQRHSTQRNRRQLPVLHTFDDGVVHALFPLAHWGKGRRSFSGHAQNTFLLVEAVSHQGPAMVSRAKMALAIETAAALLLLLVAALLLRQKLVADARALTLEAEKRALAVALERNERLKALGRMSAVLGHELKNPIAALKGHAQLLREEAATGQIDPQRIQRLIAETEQLETLTTHVLDFVRTGELQRSKVYLDDLAESAAALSGVKRIAIDAPEATTWLLDRARIEQALINLLINAGQATDDERDIHLSLRPDADALHIDVRDRGPGIAPEDLERIFQPFYTRRAKGTGLGLALAQRIAEAHGGTLQAANHPDGGALFTLTLPAVAAADKQ